MARSKAETVELILMEFQVSLCCRVRSLKAMTEWKDRILEKKNSARLFRRTSAHPNYIPNINKETTYRVLKLRMFMWPVDGIL